MNYKIFYNKRFKNDLKDILNYIRKDKKSSAENFKKELKKKIEDITLFPYKHRKSIYFDNENIRDLIYKGYIIPYVIEENKIFILGIIKYKNDF